MTIEIQGGAALPVAASNQAPAAGAAIPIAVVYDGRNVVAGPVQPVVEVTDNRVRLAGPAMPVVYGNRGNGFTVVGPPIPVYVVSGALCDALTLTTGEYVLLTDGSSICVN